MPINQLPLPKRTVLETIIYWRWPLAAALMFAEIFAEGKMQIVALSVHSFFVLWFGFLFLKSRRAFIRAVQDLEAHMCRGETKDDEDENNF